MVELIKYFVNPTKFFFWVCYFYGNWIWAHEFLQKVISLAVLWLIVIYRILLLKHMFTKILCFFMILLGNGDGDPVASSSQTCRRGLLLRSAYSSFQPRIVDPKEWLDLPIVCCTTLLSQHVSFFLPRRRSHTFTIHKATYIIFINEFSNPDTNLISWKFKLA